MVDLIGTAAKANNVGVFHRFLVMRHWSQAQQIPFESFLSPDGLHMNDWSYACVASSGHRHRRCGDARNRRCRRAASLLINPHGHSHRVQRGEEILDHVVGMLEAGRERTSPSVMPSSARACASSADASSLPDG